MSADLQTSKNWFGVAKSNSHVDLRGNIIVTSTHSGHEHTLRTPANAAQASIYFTRIDKLKERHSSAVTDTYLKDPTKLMKMYLEVIKLLSDWGYLHPRVCVVASHYLLQCQASFRQGLCQHSRQATVVSRPTGRSSS